MPTYEYQCKSCNHRFEVWQKMTDEPLTVCPECNGTIRRILFPAGIVFKGSGFYKTDHGSGAVIGDNHQNGHKEKDGASKTESAASESKTESESSKEKVSAPTGGSKTSAAAD
jgi:putative FmdB family regulatory protein